VLISGSKNACLPIIAATLLTRETCILHNVPVLSDTLHMLEVVRHLGAHVSRLGKNSWSITAEEINFQTDKELVRRLRASICFLGALLGRKQQAIVPMPGGCKLGTRPIDIHLRAFEALGAAVEITEDYIHLFAQQLTGTTFSMEGPHGPTVTGTSNAIMAAALAHEITTIQYAAKEPEIADLCCFLQQIGAKIQGVGTDTLIIEGVDSLHDTEFTIQPDRMEAGTFIILGLLCGNPIELVGASQQFLASALCGFFNEVPVSERYCHWENDTLIVSQAQDLLPFSMDTLPYPGFPTDLQPQITVLASQIAGVSRICDTIFPERFTHIPLFEYLGMQIKQSAGTIHVYGKILLTGASVAATDLRAGAALYLAGLIAKGETIVPGLEYID
jgi:UDP-N-acetylglucosamine 1-carboxyvinyltransferase